MSGAGRASERGLSLIEALVMLAATALIAALLLPLAVRGARGDFSLADRSLDAVALARAEAEFRALVQSAAQPAADAGAPPESTLSGAAQSFAIEAAPIRASVCGVGRVVFQIETVREGGRLICAAPGRSAVLLSWSDGEARFAYSRDGAQWRADWPPARTQSPMRVGEPASADIAMVSAPVVRFELLASEGPALTWIERAGGTSPLIAPPAEGAAEALAAAEALTQ